MDLCKKKAHVITVVSRDKCAYKMLPWHVIASTTMETCVILEKEICLFYSLFLNRDEYGQTASCRTKELWYTVTVEAWDFRSREKLLVRLTMHNTFYLYAFIQFIP